MINQRKFELFTLPSSVSFSDARAAASTANNFRERHGEQAKTGMQKAQDMNQKYGQQAKDMNTKYGVSSKLSGYASSAREFNRSSPAAGGAPGASGAAASSGSVSGLAGLAGGVKK